MLLRSRTRDPQPLQPTLVGVPGNEIVPGAKAGSVLTDDDFALRYAIWGEELRNPKGTVCIFQGRGEFIEKHFETAADLLSQGYAVAALDWRGQGGSMRALSNPRKGHVKSFKQYDLDLAAFMTQAVLPDCPPPYFALGHSMGGCVLVRAALTRTWFEKIVLSAPMLDLANEHVPRKLVKSAANAMKAMGLGGMQVPGQGSAGFVNWDFPNNPFTSDLTRFERTKRIMEAAPDLAVGGATFSWIAAAMEAMDSVAAIKKSTLFKVPVLIVAAGRDRVVSTRASRNFADRIPSVSTIVLDAARHEILLERDSLREQFWAAFRAFIHDQDPTVSL
ncbi:MAG: alpha/beta hydrolase [Pseudomonadota bacterium]